MLGRDVSGEAGGAAHPSGTASILAGLQSLVFLSSGFYSAHTCSAWFTAKTGQQQPSGRLEVRDWRLLVECSLSVISLSVLESSI